MLDGDIMTAEFPDKRTYAGRTWNKMILKVAHGSEDVTNNYDVASVGAGKIYIETTADEITYGCDVNEIYGKTKNITCNDDGAYSFPEDSAYKGSITRNFTIKRRQSIDISDKV